MIAKMGVATIRLTPESAALPPPVGDGEEFAFGKFELDNGGDNDDDGDQVCEVGEDEMGDGQAAAETVVVELASLLDVRLVPATQ